MYVLDGGEKLFIISNPTIVEASLPKRTAFVGCSVDLSRHKALNALHYLRQREAASGNNKGMKMVRHDGVGEDKGALLTDEMECIFQYLRCRSIGEDRPAALSGGRYMVTVAFEREVTYHGR